MSGPARGSGGLEVDGVTVAYGATVALADVRLAVARGEVVGLAGPNGAGKSTLLRAAAGLSPLRAGAVRVDGSDLRRTDPLARARGIAWMPQEEAPGDNVPLRDYVEYGRYPWGHRWAPPTADDRSATERALRETDLLDLQGRGVAELSGGERQRARLARVLAQETPFLLLDEPTAHLDIGHQLEVLGRIRAIAQRERRGLLIALHDLNLAARFTDRIAVLSHGRLVALGPPTEILSPGLLGEVWGIAAEVRRDPATGLPYLLPQLFERTKAPSSPATPSRVHVVAGGGSGALLLRALLDRGFAASAGVLPLFDTDSEIARALGIPTAVELPFAPISSATLEQLDRLLEAAEAIVVAPFPVGPSNLANLEHLLSWVARRPTLLLEQPVGVQWDYVDGRAAAVRAEMVRRGASVGAGVDAVFAWLGGLRLSPRPAGPGAPGDR